MQGFRFIGGRGSVFLWKEGSCTKKGESCVRACESCLRACRALFAEEKIWLKARVCLKTVDRGGCKKGYIFYVMVSGMVSDFYFLTLILRY
jgi:hypothetical protein